MKIWARLTGREEEERVDQEMPWAGRPTERDASGNVEPVATGPHAETEGGQRPIDPIVDSGVRMSAPPVADVSERCEHCGGRVPTDHELLTDLLEALAPAGDVLVRRFYEELFREVPGLRELFPTRIEVQEEKLLSAIVALLKLFQAGDEEMEQLDSALARFGRSHTRFEPAATIEEYAKVWTVLSGVAGEMLAETGVLVTERHAKALRRAYEYAAGKMLAAQATAKFSGTGRRRRTV